MTFRKPAGGINRRLFLGSTAGAVSLGLSGCASVPKRAPEEKKTYVLVHGAWHGGWCWRDVRKHLEREGHRVYTPTLTGLGERAHLLSADVSLQTHIQDVIGVIEAEELDAIHLVGHSYGGMVITGVADALKERIALIVYLDAAVPNSGDTMLTQGPDRSAAVISETEKALRAWAPDGVAMNVPPAAIFGIDPTNIDQANWLERRLTPHPLKTWFDPIDLSIDVPADLKGTYIICTQPAMQETSFRFHAERLRARNNWTVVEIETGHDAMVTAPHMLSQHLLST